MNMSFGSSIGPANDLAPKNHNNPPSDLEILAEQITLRHVAIIRQAEAQIAMADNIPDGLQLGKDATCTAEQEASFLTDFVKKIQTVFKELERQRAGEKEPFLRQGQFVDTFFGDMKKKLQVAENKAMAPLNAYMQAKAWEEKYQREIEAEALRQEQAMALRAAGDTSGKQAAEATKIIDHAITMTHAAEVATAAAAAPIQTMAAAKGKVGSAGLRKVWRGTLKDKNGLDLSTLRPYLTEKVLQAALDAFVKAGGRRCEGAVIEEIIETKVK